MIQIYLKWKFLYYQVIRAISCDNQWLSVSIGCNHGVGQMTFSERLTAVKWEVHAVELKVNTLQSFEAD